MTKPIEVCPHCGTQHNDYPFRTCRSCRVTHVIDINALDPLDPVHARNRDWHQKDFNEYCEEDRITRRQGNRENT